MGSGRSGEVLVQGEQIWRARKAMSGPLQRNSVSSGEGGRRMEGWSGRLWALGWDPECPLEDFNGKYSVHGNWRLLHNKQTLSTTT